MANNGAIQFLRGSGHNKTDVLKDGQPYFDRNNNLLYVGLGTGGLNTLTPVNAFYNTVITNQADFEAWYTQLDAGTYTGSSVLICEGTYTRNDGRGLCLPRTLCNLHGLGQVKININNFSYVAANNKAAVWYSDKSPSPYPHTSIRNINLSVSGTTRVYGFVGCDNLYDCTSTVAGGNDMYAFQQCHNLVNCEGIAKDYIAFYDCFYLINCIGSQSKYGFVSCRSLANCLYSGGDSSLGQGRIGYRFCRGLVSCEATVGSAGGDCSSLGFTHCEKLSNCVGNVTGVSGAHAFDECSMLNNCAGYGSCTQVPSNGTTFSNCNVCSNCMQGDRASSGSTWGGSNNNVNKDTCPEYTG